MRKRRTCTLAKVDSWSSLLGDVLCLVAEKIDFIEDYVSFCAVCRCWYALGTDLYYRKKKSDFNTPFYMSGINPHPSPVLIAPYPNYDEYYPKNPKRTPNLTFHSYASKRSFVHRLPEAAGRRCWGSQFGWLVTYGHVDKQFSLLNPFSRATIPLPSMATRFSYNPPQHWIKAFLTADPVHSPDDCLVLILLAPKRVRKALFFARPGRDKAWTHFQGRNDLDDIISFQGSLYGVITTWGLTVTIVSLQLQTSPRVVELVNTTLVPGDPSLGISRREKLIDFRCTTIKYLVVLDGEICVVLRYISGTRTAYFKIFRVDLCTGKLTRVRSLGERCLFLGNNNTFTCKATLPPPESFEQLEHPPHNFTSGLVFYTYADDWILYTDYLDYLPQEKHLYPEGIWDHVTL